MTFLDTLQQKIGFTRREAVAILVLASTFVSGVLIHRFTSSSEARATSSQQFDYSRSDSAYRAHAQIIPDSVPASQSAATPMENRANASRGEKTKGFSGTINLNTATKTQLMQLPGIGPSYAERILQYRAEHGKFASIDQLLKVKGIGEKKMEKLRPFITVH